MKINIMETSIAKAKDFVPSVEFSLFKRGIKSDNVPVVRRIWSNMGSTFSISYTISELDSEGSVDTDLYIYKQTEGRIGDNIISYKTIFLFE